MSTETKYKIVNMIFWEETGYGIKEYKNGNWELVMANSNVPVFFGTRKKAQEYINSLPLTPHQ